MADNQQDITPTNIPSLPPPDETGSYKFSDDSPRDSMQAVERSDDGSTQTPKLPTPDETNPFKKSP